MIKMYHVFEVLEYYRKLIMAVLEHAKGLTWAHFLQMYCVTLCEGCPESIQRCNIKNYENYD